MYFANPWGLLGLLALPAIVGIHLYHRRFPVLTVAGLHLWGQATETRTAGRRLDRLPITTTLLLELLAALVLSLVLARPVFGDWGARTHLVVVLDDSASLSARPPGEEPFREAAVRELERCVHDAGRKVVVTLLRTGRRPELVAGPAVEWETARAALADWQPQAVRHDFQPAWDLASQIAEGTGRMLFFTDRVPREGEPSPPPAMETVAVGRPLENTALTAARWTFDAHAGQGKIFLRLENLGRAAAETVVHGRSGEDEVFRQSVRTEAGQAASVEVPVRGGLGRIDVQCETPGDGLALDDVCTLIEPEVRTVTVANRLPADSVARRAVQKVLDRIPDVQPGEIGQAHLLIEGGEIEPPDREDLWWLGIGPPDPTDAGRNREKHFQSPFLLEKRNPLLNGLVLGGIVWAGAQPIERANVPLVSAGDQPLLVRLTDARSTAYLMDVDLARSNLTDAPDWPILLDNLVELRRAAMPGLRRWNYRVGEEVRFRLDPPAAGEPGPVLVSAGRSVPLAVGRTGNVILDAVDRPGTYEIRRGDALVGRFAVAYQDPLESTLTGLNSGTREARFETPPESFALDDPYTLFVLVGLVLIVLALVADWYVLRPRSIPA